MQFRVGDLIDRARTYVDDDHNAQKGWIKPERWLSLFGVEYRMNYRRWHRSGIISPEPTDKEFTTTVELDNVMAVIGVARGTIAGFEGGTFDIADFLDECPSATVRVTQYLGNVRPQVSFVPGVTLSLIEADELTAITFIPGVSTLEDVLELILTDSTMLEVIAYTTVDTVLDNPLNTFPTDIEGGSILMTDLTILDSPQSRASKKLWSNFEVGEASYWQAFGAGGKARIKLNKQDNTNTYIVRYYAGVAVFTDEDEVVEIADGCDERIVLGLARRALIKESAASRSIDQHIIDADAEINFMAAQKGGLQIRGPQSTPRGYYSANVYEWWWSV